MKHPMKFVTSSAVALILASIVGANASPVTVSGGFTGFSGLSAGTNGTGGVSNGCDPTFQGIVAGTTVQAASCTNGLSGPAALAFGSTLSSFEFYEKQFGSDLAHNGFSFVPAPAQTVNNTGDRFWLGTLSFTNGIWFGNGPVNFFHIGLTTVSADPVFNGHVLSDNLVMNIRVGGTPEDNGDCFFFSQFAAAGQVCAYESGVAGKTNTTTVLVWGKIGSLIPTEFTDVTGGFLIGGPTAVPEPTSLVLLGMGLAVVFQRWRRQRRG